MMLKEKRPRLGHLGVPSIQKNIKDVVWCSLAHDKQETISFLLTLLIEVKESEGEASLYLRVVSSSWNQTGPCWIRSL